MLLHLCRWLQDNSFIAAVNGTSWTAAALEIVHYFSMFVLVGSMVIVDLRVLGLVGRRQDATQLADRLLSLDMDFISIEFPVRIPHVRGFRRVLLP